MSAAAVPRIPSGPQILCIECGEICNHISLLCEKHRRPDLICTRGGERLTDADRAYLEWQKLR
jgi:hypothetical protein